VPAWRRARGRHNLRARRHLHDLPRGPQPGEDLPEHDRRGGKAACVDSGYLHWVGPSVVAGGVLVTAGRSQPSGHVEMYALNPAAGRRLPHGRADRLAPRGRGRARPRGERGLAAGRGQRGRPWVGPRGRRAAARRPAHAAPPLTRLQQTPHPPGWCGDGPAPARRRRRLEPSSGGLTARVASPSSPTRGLVCPPQAAASHRATGGRPTDAHHLPKSVQDAPFRPSAGHADIRLECGRETARARSLRRIAQRASNSSRTLARSARGV